MHQLLLERVPLQIHLTYLFGHHISDFFHEVFLPISEHPKALNQTIQSEQVQRAVLLYLAQV